MSGTLVSPQGRVAFPQVYQPTSMNDGERLKYSIILVFPYSKMEGEQLELLKRMKAEANRVAKEAFGVGIGERDKDGTIIKSPFRPTEDKPKFYEPGQIFVRFSNKFKPMVVDGAKRPILEDSDDLYSGCWARVSYTCWAFTYMGNKGVSFSLGNVQKMGDDEPFAGRRSSADDDFDVVDSGGSGTFDSSNDTSDEAAGAEIPF